MTQTMKNILFSILSSVVLLLLSSCGDDHHHENGHHHEAQHGGVLIPCGEHEYNLEIVHDHHSGDLKIYVLDAHAKHPVRIKETSISVAIDGKEEMIKLQAVANAAYDETVGNTSFFQAKGALPGSEEFKGTVKSVTIQGTTYPDQSFHYPEEDDHDH